jgi:carbon-monoxide dehydrogenase medium subunit
MVTHTQAMKAQLIVKWAPVLAEACATIGSPQIRNMATLVGNIVNAMPAADAACALVALGAVATVCGSDQKEKRVAVEQLYQGEPGKCAVDSTKEMVTALEIPVSNGKTGSSFQRISRRKALSLPVLNASVLIRLDDALQTFEEARVVLGPVAPVPFRALKAEARLQGSPVTTEAVREAAALARAEASPRTSLRGGKEYREEMVTVLVERGIRTALQRIDPRFFNL